MKRIKRSLLHFAKDRKGAMSMTVLLFMVALMVISLILLEAVRFYETYYSIETSIQRSLTSAVEMNMDDRYRADGLLYLYIDESPRTDIEEEWNLIQGKGAWADFLDFLETDLGAERNGTTFSKRTKDGKTAFIVRISSHGGEDQVLCTSPSMTVAGTVTVYPIFTSLPGVEPIRVDFSYESNAFRTEVS